MRNRKALIAVILSAVILAVGCSSDNSTSTTAPGTSLVSGSESTANSSATEAQSNVSTTPTVTTTVASETTPAVTTTAKPAEQTTVATTTTKVQETTKPAETAKTTTVATTTAKPAPEWAEEKVSATKYVNTDCYSRKKAVLGAETVKIYNVNDKVKVVAKTNTGYFKLDTGAFIHGDYLSDSKVVIQTTTTTVATTEKPNEAQPNGNDEFTFSTEHTANPIPWDESDVWYVLDTVKKYAESKGFRGCDFPSKIEHYKDTNSFGNFGSYRVTGRVWYDSDMIIYIYPCKTKQENIDYFISNMEKGIDDYLSEGDYNACFQVTVTTGTDFMKYCKAQGWSTEYNEIGCCDLGTAYVFIWNH